MSKHIKYPSIEQYRHVVSSVNRSYNYIGMDENDQPIFDPSIQKPTLTFKGTVKIHGTNSGVSYNSTNGMYFQSRKNVITPQKDNAGFAFWADSKRDVFTDLINKIIEENKIDTSKQTITIYGEWAGKGIQKGIAVAELPKSFYLFGVKISEPEVDAYWIPCEKIGNDLQEHNIHNIYDFETFLVDIDFKHPEIAQNGIVELTIAVENECPVAKQLGVSGIGEGIVFSHVSDRYKLMFKSKGEKHSKSKVKTIKEVDVTKLELIQNVVDKVTPEWRLEQFLVETFDLQNGGEITRKKMGDYIRAVINDVMKEDSDIISDAGLEPNDVNKVISTKVRDYFFKKEKEFTGL